MTAAIQQLKDTQFKYFFAVVSTGITDAVMEEAFAQGIAGNGLNTWFFSDGLNSRDILDRSFPVGSPLAKAYQGVGLIEATGGVAGMNIQYDKLALSMQQLQTSEEDMQFINDHLPYYTPNPPNYSEITANKNFLSWPGFVAPFLYDATIGLGLAACNLTSTLGRYNFTGEELFQNLIQRDFEGTSGYVVLDNVTGSRTAESAFFSVTNFVGEEDAQGMVNFKFVITNIWYEGNFTYLAPFVFNDGTTNVPADLPAITVEQNYLSSGLDAWGFILCGIIVCLSIGFGVWTYLNREVQAVRSSQPIFLLCIAAGTLIMGLGIIPLTADQGDSSEKGASAACMAFPWLLAFGFSLIFSAL